MHGCAPLAQLQKQIVVLRAVAGAVQPAHGVEQPGLKHGEMADIIAAVEVIGRKIRLEMACAGPLDAGFKQGLVGIQKRCARLAGGFQHLVHRVRGQHIVMVQQSEIFAPGQLGRGVCVGRNAVVCHLAVAHVFLCGKKLAHIGMRRIGCIRHAKLPIRAGLPGHAVPHLLKICARRVVYGHAN